MRVVTLKVNQAKLYYKDFKTALKGLMILKRSVPNARFSISSKIQKD